MSRQWWWEQPDGLRIVVDDNSDLMCHLTSAVGLQTNIGTAEKYWEKVHFIYMYIYASVSKLEVLSGKKEL